MDVCVPSPDDASLTGSVSEDPNPESHTSQPRSSPLPPASLPVASLLAPSQTLSPNHNASPHECAPEPMVLEDDAIRNRMAELQLHWKDIKQTELYGSVTTEEQFEAVYTLLEEMGVASVMLHVPGKTLTFTRSEHGLHQLVVNFLVSAVWEEESEEREAASLDAQDRQQAHVEPNVIYDDTTECDTESGSDGHEAVFSDNAMDADVLVVDEAQLAAAQVEAVGCSVELSPATLAAAAVTQSSEGPVAHTRVAHSRELRALRTHANLAGSGSIDVNESLRPVRRCVQRSGGVPKIVDVSQLLADSPNLGIERVATGFYTISYSVAPGSSELHTEPLSIVLERGCAIPEACLRIRAVHARMQEATTARTAQPHTPAEPRIVSTDQLLVDRPNLGISRVRSGGFNISYRVSVASTDIVTARISQVLRAAVPEACVLINAALAEMSNVASHTRPARANGPERQTSTRPFRERSRERQQITSTLTYASKQIERGQSQATSGPITLDHQRCPWSMLWLVNEVTGGCILENSERLATMQKGGFPDSNADTPATEPRSPVSDPDVSAESDAALADSNTDESLSSASSSSDHHSTTGSEPSCSNSSDSPSDSDVDSSSASDSDTSEAASDTARPSTYSTPEEAAVAAVTADLMYHCHQDEALKLKHVERFNEEFCSNMDLFVCASCGVRNPEVATTEHELDETLLKLLRLPQKSIALRTALQCVSMTDAEGTFRDVDMSSLVNCFLHNGALYALRQAFVDDSGEIPKCRLCPHCSGAFCPKNPRTQPTVPRMSLAAGVDLGNRDFQNALDFLPTLSDVERLALSNVRTYAQILKIVVPDSKLTAKQLVHRELVGHFISFVQNAPVRVMERLDILQQLQQLGEVFTLFLVGPDQSRDVLADRARGMQETALRPHVLHNHLKLAETVAASLSRVAGDDHSDGGVYSGTASRIPPFAELRKEAAAAHDRIFSDALHSTDVNLEHRACGASDQAGVRTGVGTKFASFLAGDRLVWRGASPTSNATPVDADSTHPESDGINSTSKPKAAEGISVTVVLTPVAVQGVLEVLVKTNEGAEHVVPANELEHTGSSEEAESEDAGRSRKVSPRITVGRVALMPNGACAGDIMRSQVDAIEKAVYGDTLNQATAAAANEDVNVDPRGPVKAERSKAPINEFTDNNRLIGEAFWYDFPLGCAFLKQGTQPTYVIKALLLYHDNRLACNSDLIFLHANQKQRHAVAQSISARVKLSAYAFKMFCRASMDPDFPELLKAAKANPTGDSAGKLQRMIVPFLDICGRSVPWSAAERKSLQSELWALARRFGPASIFWTISPDDVHMGLVLRMCTAAKDNESFPATAGNFEERMYRGETPPEILTDGRGISLSLDSELEETLQKLVTSNPVAAAVVYRKLIFAVTKVLMQCAVDTSSTKKTVPVGSRPKSMFGTPLANYYVTEVQARMALHCHGLFWGGFMPAMLANLAAHRAVVNGVLRDALKSAFSSSMTLPEHLVDTARISCAIPPARASFAPIPTDSTSLSECGVACAFSSQMHRHCNTCHVGDHGRLGCRMGCEFPHSDPSLIMVQLQPRVTSTTNTSDDDATGDVDPNAEDARPPPDLMHPEALPTDKWLCDRCHQSVDNDAVRCWDVLHPRIRESAGVFSGICQDCSTNPNPKQPGVLIPKPDERFLALELERPQLQPTLYVDGLLELLKTCPGKHGHIADYATMNRDEAKRIVLNAFAQTEVAAVLERSTTPARLRAKIKYLDGDTACKIVLSWSNLNCRNASVTTFVDVLSACIGCNTAPLLLGADVAAKAAMFYLVKYVTKDSNKVCDAISVLLKAQSMHSKYGSLAPDADSNENRSAMNYAARALNGQQAELADTQSVACALDHKANGCSEVFVWTCSNDVMNIGRFLARSKYIWPGLALLVSKVYSTAPSMQVVDHQHLGDSCDADNDENDDLCSSDDGGDLLDSDDDESSEDEDALIEATYLGARDEVDDEMDGARFKRGAQPADKSTTQSTMFAVNYEGPGGLPIALSPVLHYLYRGWQLQSFGYMEYVSCFQTVKLPAEAQTPATGQPGRKNNSAYPFADGHPLKGLYHQVALSKLRVHRLSRNPPRCPRALGEGIVPSRTWLKQRKRFAAYMICNFVPWPTAPPPPDANPDLFEAGNLHQTISGQTYLGCVPPASKLIDGDMLSTIPGPPDLKAESLSAWISRLQEQSTHAFPDNMTYRAPGPLPLESATPARIAVLMLHDIAINRLLWLTNFVHTCTAGALAKRLAMQLKMRSRHLWTHGETNAYAAQKNRSEAARTKDAKADTSIAAARAQMEGSVFNPRRASDAAVREAFLERQTLFHAELGQPTPLSEQSDAVGASIHDESSSPEQAARSAVGGIMTLANSRKSVGIAYSRMISILCSPPPTLPERSSENVQTSGSDGPSAADQDPPEFIQLELAQYNTYVHQWRVDMAAWEDTDKQMTAQGLPHLQQRPSPPLNEEQRAFCRKLLPVLRAIRTARDNGESRQLYAPRLSRLHKMIYLLIGAAGTGKTQLLATLETVCLRERFGTFIFCTYTGASAIHVPRGCTCYAVTGLDGQYNGKQLEAEPPDAATHASFLARAGDLDTLLAIVVDEISFVAPAFLHHFSTRLAQLLNCPMDFGGLLTILPGDFHQLEPVKPTLMLIDVLVSMNLSKIPGLARQPTPHLPSSTVGKGMLIFGKARRVLLTEQMRAQDLLHAKHMLDMRNTSLNQPVTDAFIATLVNTDQVEAGLDRSHSKILNREDMQNPEFAFAKFGLISNAEVDASNYTRARQYARYHKRPFFMWRLTNDLNDKVVAWHTKQEVEHLVDAELSLIGYMVQGFPGQLVKNLNVNAELANGTPLKYHSLCLNVDDSQNRTMVGANSDIAKVEHLDPSSSIRVKDDVLEVALSKSPYSVNVEPMVSVEAKRNLMDNGASLSTTQLIIPLKNVFTKKCRLESVYAAQNCWPTPVSAQVHPVRAALSGTDYNCQGSTQPFFVMGLNPRKLRPFLTIRKLYTLSTRVRRGNRLRVLPCKDGFAFLKHLRHSPLLVLWELAYTEEGDFSVAKLASAAKEHAARLDGLLAADNKRKKVQQQRDSNIRRRHTGTSTSEPRTATNSKPSVQRKKLDVTCRMPREYQNSGSIDTVLAVLEGAHRLLLESDAANVSSYPSPLHLQNNSMQVGGTVDLETPLRAYLAVRDQIYSTNTIVAAKLKQSRDAVRREVNLLELYSNHCKTISQLAHRALDPRFILSALTRGCKEWLAVHQLPDCQCQQGGLGLEQRLHLIHEEHLNTANGVVLDAFAAQYLNQHNAPCCACAAKAEWSPQFEPKQEEAWCDGGASAAPALLAVTLRFAATATQSEQSICIQTGSVTLSHNVCVEYRPQSVMYQCGEHCIADLYVSAHCLQYNNRRFNGDTKPGGFITNHTKLAFPFAVRDTKGPGLGHAGYVPVIVLFERVN